MAASFDPDNTPALMPPAGVASNLTHIHDTQPLLVGTATACMALTTICTAIRLFTKLAILKQLNIEDYVLVLAWLGFAGYSGVLLVNCNAGEGQHQWNVSVTSLSKVALFANMLEILYGPVMFAAKAAVLLALKRIFTAGQRNLVHWSFVSLIALNGLFYLSIFFIFLFACVPRAKITNPALPGRCISVNGSILGTAVFNIFSDVSILFLPLFVVWSLQTPWKRKVTAGAIFATGFLACVSSILRLYYSILLTITDDMTWAIYPVGLWSLAEITTVILACCFPVFPRFFHHIRNGGRNERSATIDADRYGTSYRANSCGYAFRRKHHVYQYAEATMSTEPWVPCTAEHVIGKGDYSELSEKNMSDGGCPVPVGAIPGIMKTVVIETRY